MPSHTEGLAALLVDADQQTGLLLAAVEVVAGVADDGHAEAPGPRVLPNRFGEEIHVLHGNHRVGHAEHGAHLVDPVAGGVDHHLAGDVRLDRMHDELSACVFA